jgi:hypothetical protein
LSPWPTFWLRAPWSLHPCCELFSGLESKEQWWWTDKAPSELHIPLQNSLALGWHHNHNIMPMLVTMPIDKDALPLWTSGCSTSYKHRDWVLIFFHEFLEELSKEQNGLGDEWLSDLLLLIVQVKWHYRVQASWILRK